MNEKDHIEQKDCIARAGAGSEVRDSLENHALAEVVDQSVLSADLKRNRVATVNELSPTEAFMTGQRRKPTLDKIAEGKIPEGDRKNLLLLPFQTAGQSEKPVSLVKQAGQTAQKKRIDKGSYKSQIALRRRRRRELLENSCNRLSASPKHLSEEKIPAGRNSHGVAHKWASDNRETLATLSDPETLKSNCVVAKGEEKDLKKIGVTVAQHKVPAQPVASVSCNNNNPTNPKIEGLKSHLRSIEQKSKKMLLLPTSTTPTTSDQAILSSPSSAQGDIIRPLEERQREKPSAKGAQPPHGSVAIVDNVIEAKWTTAGRRDSAEKLRTRKSRSMRGKTNKAQANAVSVPDSSSGGEKPAVSAVSQTNSLASDTICKGRGRASTISVAANPDENSSRSDAIAEQELRPGAYTIPAMGHDDGVQRSAYDSSAHLGSAYGNPEHSTLPPRDASTPILEATLVTQEEEHAQAGPTTENRYSPDEAVTLAVATKDSFCRHLRHDRRTQIGLCGLVLLIIGLVVGLSFTVGNDGDTSDNNGSQTQKEEWVQTGFNIDGTDEDGEFGHSVSLSAEGIRVAIGAPSTKTDRLGRVQVFELNSTEWVQLGSDMRGDDSSDEMGRSVSISKDGKRVAVGSPGHFLEGTALEVGLVRIYEYVSGKWTQIGQTIHGEVSNELCGYAVSLSENGSFVAIASPGSSTEGPATGLTRVFQYSDGNWIQLGDNLVGAGPNNYFGSSVSLSANGKILAVGSVSSPGRRDSVSLKVFQYTADTWNLLGEAYHGDSSQVETAWSTSLSDDGTIVAIGSFLPFFGGKPNATIFDKNNNNLVVRVFQFVQGAWMPLGGDIHGKVTGMKSGYIVSLSGTGKMLSVGDPGDSTLGGEEKGHTHVFRYQRGEWVHVSLEIFGEDTGDASGTSVSLSSNGRRVAVGAPRKRNRGQRSVGGRVEERGDVRIFDLEGVAARAIFEGSTIP